MNVNGLFILLFSVLGGDSSIHELRAIVEKAVMEVTDDTATINWKEFLQVYFSFKMFQVCFSYIEFTLLYLIVCSLFLSNYLFLVAEHS